MDRALHSRRRVLLAGGTAVAVGLAGCTDSSRTDEAPAEDDADDEGGDDGGAAGEGGMDDPPEDEGQDDLGRGDDEPTDEEQGDADTTVAVGPGGELQFDPATVEIQGGGTVRWEWESADHTVSPDATPAEADWEGVEEPQEGGYVYEHTFEVEGTYDYHCHVHEDSDMEGRVVVGE